MEVTPERDTFTGPASNCTIAIKPLDFSDLMVGKKTEAQYLAEKSPEDASKFQSDKEQAAASFVAAAVTQAAPFASPAPDAKATWTGFVHVTFWEPGYYIGISSRPAKMNLTYQIQDRSGKVVEQWSEHMTPSAGAFTASSSGRMQLGGRLAGEVFGRMLQRQLQCAK